MAREEVGRGGPVVVEEGVFVAFGLEAREAGGEEGEVGGEGEEGEGVGEWGGDEEDLEGRGVSFAGGEGLVGGRRTSRNSFQWNRRLIFNRALKAPSASSASLSTAERKATPESSSRTPGISTLSSTQSLCPTSSPVLLSEAWSGS